MSTFRYTADPGSLFIVWRQSSTVEGTGTILPTRIGGRMEYLGFPDGGFRQWRGFGITAASHDLDGILSADSAGLDGTFAIAGAPVSHDLIGVLEASEALMTGAMVRTSGSPVSHDLDGVLSALDALMTGATSIGSLAVVHDLFGVLSAGAADILECICVGPDEGIMPYSGTVSLTRFNTRRVIDMAYRQCRLNSQQISAEMLANAKDALYTQLSELANGKPPSWCIERIVLPMYENQPIVPLPPGSVSVLNMNYRTLQLLSGTITQEPQLYQVQFDSATTVATVGIKWSCCSTTVSLDTSPDGVVWTQVGSQSGGAAGSPVWTWYDISAAKAALYFRITSNVPMDTLEVVLGNMPCEIPMGVLNRDQYVDQSNKIFASQPTTYWFQRDLAFPVVNIWPAPWPAAERAQLVVWRHRHVMDVGTLAQALEVPQRWMKSVIASLAATLAAETPLVDPALIPVLEGKAAMALQLARDGDNDGSPSFWQPSIGMYTA